MQATTIGLDLAKNVFQVHGVNEQGQIVVARKLRRGQLMKRLLRSLRRKAAEAVIATAPQQTSTLRHGPVDGAACYRPPPRPQALRRSRSPSTEGVIGHTS